MPQLKPPFYSGDTEAQRGTGAGPNHGALEEHPWATVWMGLPPEGRDAPLPGLLLLVWSPTHPCRKVEMRASFTPTCSSAAPASLDTARRTE